MLFTDWGQAFQKVPILYSVRPDLAKSHRRAKRLKSVQVRPIKKILKKEQKEQNTLT
jgi:hypothetical protein